MVLKRADEPEAARRHRRDALDRARADRGRHPARLRARRDPPARPSRPTASGTASTWGRPTRSRARRSGSPTRRERLGIGLRGDLVRDARARRRVQRGAGRRRRADRRRARRLGRPDRRARVRSARRRGGLPHRRRAVEADRVQRRRARPRRRATSARRGAGGCARTRGPRGLARARGGRGQGRARADRVGAGAARDPRRRPPGRGAGLLDALGARLAHVAPVRPRARSRAAARGAALLADGLAGGRYAPLVERLRLREARGGVSTTCGCTAPSGSGCAEPFAQRRAPRPSRRSSPSRPKPSATTLCWWIVSRFSWRAETNASSPRSAKRSSAPRIISRTQSSDEARPPVRLLDDLDLVRALHQLVDLELTSSPRRSPAARRASTSASQSSGQPTWSVPMPRWLCVATGTAVEHARSISSSVKPSARSRSRARAATARCAYGDAVMPCAARRRAGACRARRPPPCRAACRSPASAMPDAGAGRLREARGDRHLGAPRVLALAHLGRDAPGEPSALKPPVRGPRSR